MVKAVDQHACTTALHLIPGTSIAGMWPKLGRIHDNAETLVPAKDAATIVWNRGLAHKMDTFTCHAVDLSIWTR